MKDGHIQNIKTILFTYIYIYNPSNLSLEIQFSKSHNLKLAGYHCDCPLGGEVVQPHLYLYHESSKCSPAEMTSPTCLTSCIQECTLLWSAVAMSVSLPASSSLLDSPLKDSRQAQSELNILNMGLLGDTDLYFFIVSMIILNSKFVNSKKMLLRLFADL